MGNNPSSTSTASSSSTSTSATAASGADPAASSLSSPRSARRDPYRSPISVGHSSHGVAAPPERSNTLAQGASVPNRPILQHLQQQQQHQHQHHQHHNHHHHPHHQNQHQPQLPTPIPANAETALPASPVRPHHDLAVSWGVAAPRAVPVPVPSRDGVATRSSAAEGATAATAALAAAGSRSEDEPPLGDHQGSPATPTAATTATAATAPNPAGPASIMTGSASASITDMSYLTRPPRLPLPIEEELKTPGSPIAGPMHAGQIIDDDGDGDVLSASEIRAIRDGIAALGDCGEEGAAGRGGGGRGGRGRGGRGGGGAGGGGADHSIDGPAGRSLSAAAAATAEDELIDHEAREQPGRRKRPVPTRLEWLNGGDKVYVTGTIFQWNRKHRLLPVEGRPGVFAVTIDVVPGIHHVRFLVDGLMQTAKHLPMTVDLANNLVNYIVVGENASDPGPGAAAAAGVARPSDQTSAAARDEEEEAKRPKSRSTLPSNLYLDRVPQYLTDFDQAEESTAYQYAITAIEKLPNPPGLPGFLAKPILNAPTVAREDNSVLMMPPNHTVLNHLATSSIKNNVLAVSATTRYKAKYVTTILYKPTLTEEAP